MSAWSIGAKTRFEKNPKLSCSIQLRSISALGFGGLHCCCLSGLWDGNSTFSKCLKWSGHPDVWRPSVESDGGAEKERCSSV